MNIQDLADSMTWSHSRISCFHDCKYKFFLRYVLNEPEEPCFYSSYGSFIHKLLEKHYKDGVPGDELCNEFLLGFNEAVRGDRPAEKTLQKYITDGVLLFSALPELPCKVVAVEQEVRFEVNGYPFVGFIDAIGQDGDKLYIIDHKSHNYRDWSCRNKPTQNDEDLHKAFRQLYLYAIAVKKLYGRYPDTLILNCFRNGKLIKETFCEAGMNLAKYWAWDSIQQIRCCEDFQPNIDYFRCNNLCGYRDVCEHYQMFDWKE